MDKNTLRILSRCIEYENAKAFNDGLAFGLAALERARVNIAVNHTLKEPVSEDTLAEWVGRDLTELRTKTKDPGPFPRV